ncbi:hypothetical protein TRAPUB_645 [Trametes pubescens]|uniref:Uncharacterized protein n=1 Tax=Trametes pubescens TaxID=154538 RepID=A0A1M2VLQ0_TRAPU|nr:hypothetical protein TRAPUB_645 [Trametes pubescens]
MSLIGHSCDTFIPTKRSAPTDFEPLRISRSMISDDPYSRNLLIDRHSPPPVSASSRRRVNPESLAVRLGPELVRELESYVKPGVVEMPSFAIRQQIQMRYKVDRRHIYDWFHSKGLRVTKEDKRATVEQKTDAMRMQRRIRRCLAPAVPPAANMCPGLSDSATDSAPSSPALLTPVAIPSEFQPILAPTPAKFSSSDHHSIVRPKRDVLRTVDSTTWLSSVPVKESSSAVQVLHQMASKLVVPPRPPAGYTRKFRDLRIETVFSTNDVALLDRTKREACYDTLSRVLGPAAGVQECVGTYKAHMARQLEIYYEEFLPCDSTPLSDSSIGTAGVATTLQSQTSTLGSHSSVSSSGDSTHFWGALSTILDEASYPQVAPSCSVPEAANWRDNFATSSFDCLALEDILTIPEEQTDLVAFAPYSKMLPPPAQLVSLSALPFFGNSSSSLAGALGEVSPAFVQHEQDARRRSKEWVRPRMGRARAYSAGGGM